MSVGVAHCPHLVQKNAGLSVKINVCAVYYNARTPIETNRKGIWNSSDVPVRGGSPGNTRGTTPPLFGPPSLRRARSAARRAQKEKKKKLSWSCFPSSRPTLLPLCDWETARSPVGARARRRLRHQHVLLAARSITSSRASIVADLWLRRPGGQGIEGHVTPPATPAVTPRTVDPGDGPSGNRQLDVVNTSSPGGTSHDGVLFGIVGKHATWSAPLVFCCFVDRVWP